MMKKNFLRSLLVSAVMLGGFTSVQASDSSVEGMFNELCHGRSVMISKATFQGYLSSYPALGNLLASEVEGQGDVARVLALADNLHIAPNFHENTLTFNLYSNGTFLASRVLHDETQADLENYRQIARQYLASAVDPQVMLGSFASVQSSDSSVESMFNELCHGGSVMISKTTFQGYLNNYPALRTLLASEAEGQGDVARVLALADHVHIAPDFNANTLTFSLYSNGTFLARHVLHDETQAKLENYRQIARQYLASTVAPQVQQVVTPLQAAPVRVLSPLEQELERLRALPTSRLNNAKIAQIEKQIQSQNSSK